MHPPLGHDARNRLVDACLALVRTASPTGEEKEIAGHLEHWALSQRRLGRDDVIRHGNGLIIGQPDGRPCVALVGHLDTVPPEAARVPFADARRVVGRGAADMKGSIAVMQALVENLDLDLLPFCLLLVLYDREEGPHEKNGLQPLLDRYETLRSVDLAIVMEPTANTLQLGAMGGLHATVRFRGKAAHSARPWEGDNAIHKAAPLLMRLRERAVQEVTVEGLTFRESMNITTARGGGTRNVIPDLFELNLNYRFAPSRPADDAVKLVLDEVRSASPEAEIDIVDLAPPGPVPVDNPILDHLRSEVELGVGPKEAWTDVARLAAHGVDAVNFGPGAPECAHQADEWVSADALVKAYEILARVLTTPLRAISPRQAAT